DNKLINCMGMASEDMWNRPMSPISRCSDDFLPENRPWFTKHILQCSYNSMIQGQFIICDWDMWWTGDTQALKNSVLRAISGGPIYVSDKLWESHGEILKPLVLSDGRILRCDRPAMPSRDCVTENPEKSGKPFKVQNICSGSGVVAAFNLDNTGRSVSGTVSPKDVEGLDGDEFALYEYFSGDWFIVDRDAAVEFVLPDSDTFRLYIIVPVNDGFAPIGLTEKMISPKSIIHEPDGSITARDHGTYAYIRNGVFYTEEK
ncbi:MAG: Sip1-related alpha-galactosidase, partial [Clostridiaceae bacterium]|nr:Sip1-related alpha-galactosidase [Clostridiaceae bacterium]